MKKMEQAMQTQNCRPGLLIAALVLSVSACAPIPGSRPPAAPPPPVTSIPPESDSEPAGPALPAITPKQSPARPASNALEQLLDRAWDYYRAGQYESAVSTAERAQRIDARSPRVYLVLASSHLALGSQSLAAQFARRGINYSAVGSTVRRQLQEILQRVAVGS